jgi:phosphomannomutase
LAQRILADHGPSFDAKPHFAYGLHISLQRKANSMPLTCFKAYDVRGRVGVDLTPDIAFRIGRAFGQTLLAKRVVIGRDCRPSSPYLSEATIQGLMAAGAEVLDLGLCGTEEVYHATTYFEADGGIEITASHNPAEDNGMKMVAKGSAPLDPDTTFAAIRTLTESGCFHPAQQGTRRPAIGARDAYVAHALSFIETAALKPMTILVNAGNGAAGPTFDAVATALGNTPLRFIRHNHPPDSSFPNGVPNPQLPQNHAATANAVVASGADIGVAWDGDFDRCFFFDHTGAFIPGEYIVGLLARAFLTKEPGAAIAYEPRVIWNTEDIIAASAGQRVLSRTGHSHMKRALRDHNAVYGGEMSAHHYFRDFMACDSGMIPWLLVAELISNSGTSLANLIAPRIAAFPSSGEINFATPDPRAAVARVRTALATNAISIGETDGLSLTFPNWRLNLRHSNTESLLRLNVEARGSRALVDQAVASITALIDLPIT